MWDYIALLFAFLWVIALVFTRRLDNKCLECQNTDTISWIIGGYIGIILIWPHRSKLLFEKWIDKISDFSMSFKKRNDKK